MKKKGGLIILLLLAGVIVYAASRKPKRRGSVEIGPLEGEFINDPAQLLSDEEKTMFEI